jgi:hypothetical protein
VLFHHFREHFVLLAQLGFQSCDLLLQVLLCGCLLVLEGRSAILEKRLLPPVKHGRMDPVLVTQVRDRNPLYQVTFQNGHLLLGAVLLPLFWHRNLLV